MHRMAQLTLSPPLACLQVLRKEVQERAQEITEAASGRMTAEKALAATQARCQALEGTVSNTERDFGSIKSQLERQLEHRTQVRRDEEERRSQTFEPTVGCPRVFKRTVGRTVPTP